mgnify:CR=1 FL=1
MAPSPFSTPVCRCRFCPPDAGGHGALAADLPCQHLLPSRATLPSADAAVPLSASPPSLQGAPGEAPAFRGAAGGSSHRGGSSGRGGGERQRRRRRRRQHEKEGQVGVAAPGGAAAFWDRRAGWEGGRGQAGGPLAGAAPPLCAACLALGPAASPSCLPACLPGAGPCPAPPSSALGRVPCRACCPCRHAANAGGGAPGRAADEVQVDPGGKAARFVLFCRWLWKACINLFNFVVVKPSLR